MSLSNVQKSIDNVNLEINSAKLKTDITNSVIDRFSKTKYKSYISTGRIK